MDVIFKGTTAECIQHLRDSIQGDSPAARRTIAAFAGVNEPSVRRWFAELNSCLPVGEPLVKIRFYLEFLGYEVEELQSLHPIIRDAARIVAFGAASIEEAVAAVGYTEGRNGTDNILRIFRGAHGVSKERLDHLSSFVDLYSDQLAEQKKMTQRVDLGDVGSLDEVQVEQKATPLPVRLAPQQSSGTRETLIEALAALVKATIPLAREISSDRFTPEERAKVRELTGGDGVFILANELYRLCGERSRSMRP